MLKTYRYSTRTEFIRDAIRCKLTDFEKNELIKKLEQFKGSLKPKTPYKAGETFEEHDERIGEEATREFAKKMGIKL